VASLATRRREQRSVNEQEAHNGTTWHADSLLGDSEAAINKVVAQLSMLDVAVANALAPSPELHFIGDVDDHYLEEDDIDVFVDVEAPMQEAVDDTGVQTPILEIVISRVVATPPRAIGNGLSNDIEIVEIPISPCVAKCCDVCARDPQFSAFISMLADAIDQLSKPKFDEALVLARMIGSPMLNQKAIAMFARHYLAAFEFGYECGENE
jgi:hypothetical protein